ncbi:MAG TPA: glycosyl transferase [Burkholderiaceae bacterium]|nr:glycosyl transferase [Burkholderiaceae bacterium]
MPPLAFPVVLAMLAALISWLLIGLYARAMAGTRQLDVPNARSMHRAPVPVGAGAAIVATIFLLWPPTAGAATSAHAPLLAGLAGLAGLSWIDDRRQLSPAVRLGAQAAAVALCLALLPATARLASGVPLAIERLALALAWLWFINLFNFMDGIDGLAGSEAVAIATGYLLLLSAMGLDGPLWRLALIIAAASAGYLLWNWHPAKVFMGDAGSIPLGFLLGWLMLDLGLRGRWSAAAILPLYFLCDATITLARRALRGNRPWEAHREHFYQRAVLAGASPAAVVCLVSATNLALLVLAVVSRDRPLPALAAALAAVALLLLQLQRMARRRTL